MMVINHRFYQGNLIFMCIPLCSTGATYRFRIVAVYSNNDNKQGPNSARFTLEIVPAMRPRVPSNRPVIVEAKPLRSDSIQIKWQVRHNHILHQSVCDVAEKFVQYINFYGVIHTKY